MEKIKLLIVEDKVVTVLSIKMKFEKNGFPVCKTATNNKKALEIYKWEHPDVVLIDIRLSKGINGIETCDQMQKLDP